MFVLNTQNIYLDCEFSNPSYMAACRFTLELLASDLFGLSSQ